MAEETKSHFTHTDGYVEKNNYPKSDTQSTIQNGKGFFSDNEEDEDIVTKIHHWKMSNANQSSTQNPSKRPELQKVFAGVTIKDESQPESDENIPVQSDDIQLNRLLDDYMLGKKGDRIMQQMEDLATDDPPSQEQKVVPELQNTKSKHEEPSLNLDAMLSMEDFEKYIAEN